VAKQMGMEEVKHVVAQKVMDYKDWNVVPYHSTLLLLCFMYYIFILIILPFQICHKMWTTWAIKFKHNCF
jgi:hypothetical protein